MQSETGQSEFHDLSELVLNTDGQSWGNLGYWRDAEDYSNACRALALQVGEAAQLDEHSVVFDAGFGCGDQLVLWLDNFHVAKISGINFSQSQTALAKENLHKAGYVEASDTIGQGDACEYSFWRTESEINRIVAVDCVYHFTSRKQFLQNAFDHLEKSGRIALTDIILSSERTSSFWHRMMLLLMLRLSRIAAGNMTTENSYISELQEIGFSAVKLIDISKSVMPCFGIWLARATDNGTLKLSIPQRIKYGVTAWFLGWAHRKDMLRYCLISAVKH